MTLFNLCLSKNDKKKFFWTETWDIMVDWTNIFQELKWTMIIFFRNGFFWIWLNYTFYENCYKKSWLTFCVLKEKWPLTFTLFHFFGNCCRKSSLANLEFSQSLFQEFPKSERKLKIERLKSDFCIFGKTMKQILERKH